MYKRRKSSKYISININLENSYFDCSDDWFINNNILDYSYITIKVKGKQRNRIFYAKNSEKYCSSFQPPDEVLINNIKKNYVHYEYDFEEEENDVKLIWHNQVNFLGCSFLGCTKIVFADLSHFDSSNVVTISSMFSGCNSLIYANFTNFKTSNCNAMNWMFYGCSSLISLDLSSFNTESVRSIDRMFEGCNNLQYIN